MPMGGGARNLKPLYPATRQQITMLRLEKKFIISRDCNTISIPFKIFFLFLNGI